MKAAPRESILRKAPDPVRARQFLKLLGSNIGAERVTAWSDEQLRIVVALFSGSQALSNALLAQPDLLAVLRPENLKFPRRKQGLVKQITDEINPRLGLADYPGVFRSLRLFKQQEMLRIAARDLAGLAPLEELLQELSDVADVCLEQAWNTVLRQMGERYGRPCSQDPEGRWHEATACVLGMGKLGGQELNYSSDVDLLFVYGDEGAVFKNRPGKDAPAPVLKNHQFFNRAAEAFISEVTRLAPEGTLYRVDMRLRPEGDTGPLTRSLAGYENYYAQWGQTWERMMLIKTRRVAGDAQLAAEFLEMVQPFRYPRSINENVLREVAAMKDRIDSEVVKAGELERNVKLGHGGIREIEFIAQSLQLLRAGRQPFLQERQTLLALDRLAQYELITADEAEVLSAAYRFLRAVEHRLQMEDNRQTHTIPPDAPSGERLARLMGFASRVKFESALRTHTAHVRRAFVRILRPAESESTGQDLFPERFEGEESRWQGVLAEAGFKDPEKAFRVIREFVEGPGYVHVSSRTATLARRLLARLFALCPSRTARIEPEARVLSDPDRVVTRMDSYIAAYGARATLFELWDRNPSIFELLVLLFDRSEFLAELAIRVPDLVDELVSSDRLRQRKTAEETLRDLCFGLQDTDQHLWIRRYHQAELMRIGSRDILGLADFEQYLVELSSLADACLRYALESVMHRHRLAKPPFAVIGLGKLGGAEIDYGSDLDILFVVDSKARNLPVLGKLALEVMDLITCRTEQGIVFQMDARLRPDGEKGLLVNTLAAYEDYYRSRAQLWEIQSLTRARVVAGDSAAGATFQKMADRLSNFHEPARPLAAYSSDWMSKILQMRMRIEKERTPVGKNDLAIKTGSGGLVDAEFIAQVLCMAQGWREANTLRALERAQAAGLLPDARALIDAYRRLRRIEGILRRWSYEGETVLPDDPAPFYRVSVRCGYPSPDAFRGAVAQFRATIRHSFLQVFGSGESVRG